VSKARAWYLFLLRETITSDILIFTWHPHPHSETRGRFAGRLHRGLMHPCPAAVDLHCGIDGIPCSDFPHRLERVHPRFSLLHGMKHRFRSQAAGFVSYDWMPIPGDGMTGIEVCDALNDQIGHVRTRGEACSRA
jgi:hypothetical protein